jgi:pyrroline-5-carboxylate reductase
MGQALVSGFLANGLLKPQDICVFDTDIDKAESFSRKISCSFANDLSSAVKDADYCLLAVKPQVIDKVVYDLLQTLSNSAVIISIAASVKISRLRALLREGTPIARVMPNTPALVGAAVNAICFDKVSKEDQSFVLSLFSTCGMVVPCTETQLDAIGCVSGTGPAYVMLFIESLADAAVKLGIPRDTALKIAAQTVYGSGKLALETGMHPALLKDQVCSPGGTTIEGVLALEKYGLRAAVEAAVEAADQKTKLLAGGS